MIKIIGNADENINKDAWVCICFAPGCQSSEEYMVGYAEYAAERYNSTS